MSRLSFVKAVVALCLVVFGVPGWLSAKQARSPKNTLVASSDEVKRFGIVSYRVHQAETENQNIKMRADLIGPENTEVGKWTEVRSLDGESRETVLEFDGRKIVSTVVGQQAKLAVDGVELVNVSKSAPVGSATEQQSVAQFANYLEIISRVRHEVQPVLKLAEQHLREWNQMQFAPVALRPLALALYRALPTGESLFAASRDEGGPGCSGVADVCGDDWDEKRSVACQTSTQEANNECSDWIWCLGCCAMADCDCTCVFGDFFCACLRCGARCTPPI